MSQSYYELVTPAAEPPITYDIASDWCRDINIADTTLVESLILGVNTLLEGMMNRIFVTKGYTGYLSTLCLSAYENHPFVEITKAPLIAISEIRINGTIVSSSDYIIKQSSGYSRILFPSPDILDTDLAYPIEIDFTAGYGAAATVPDDIITAIQQTVLFWYENRGDVSTDEKQQIPFVAKQIVKQRRIVATFG